MKQEEVFEFLCMQRLTGEHKYWRKIEIYNEMKKNGYTTGDYGKHCIGAKVNALYRFKFLEMIQDDDSIFPIQRFRVKEKYLKEEVEEVTIFSDKE